MTPAEIDHLTRGIARRYCRAVPDLFDDAVQDAWVAVLKVLPTYNPARGSMRGYLAVIIARRLQEVLERRWRDDARRAPADTLDTLEAGMASAERQLRRWEWCGRVQAAAVEAIRGLPDGDAALDVLGGEQVPVVCRTRRCNPVRARDAVAAARPRLMASKKLQRLFKEAA